MLKIIERINELSENLTKLVSADQSKHMITIRANNQERHHVSTCLVRYAGGGRRQGLVAAVLGQAESVSAEPPTRSAESSSFFPLRYSHETDYLVTRVLAMISVTLGLILSEEKKFGQ